MKTLAIISEYNPFHNGHKYQLETAKGLTGADYAIALMGGNFLQRGEPAYWNKYSRSLMALYGGLDLVLELPFCYATGSAGDFAMGAVNILNRLNSIDYLCFGAETDDMSLFDRISEIIIKEDDIYTAILKDNLKKGDSYAKARATTLAEILQIDEVTDFLALPNNILALEYICALKRTGSDIKPVIIKRINAGYNDTKIYNSISSASAIRAAINNLQKCDKTTETPIKSCDEKDNFGISLDVPQTTLKLVNDAFGKTSPVYADDLAPFLLCSIMSKQNILSDNRLCGDFSDICDINTDISNKLNKLAYPINYHTVLDSLCSRRYTSTRINRTLLHLIFNYTNDMRSSFFENGYAYYANILGMKKESSSGLRYIKSVSSIPLITKKADFKKCLDEYEGINFSVANDMWRLDITATRLYNQLIYNKYGTELKDDFSQILPVI